MPTRLTGAAFAPEDILASPGGGAERKSRRGRPSSPRSEIVFLAECARRAQRGSPQEAARTFLAWVRSEEFAESVVVGLLEQFTTMTEAEIAAFGRLGQAFRIRGRWGELWFCPEEFPRAGLVPELPVVTPSGLRALALGLLEELR